MTLTQGETCCWSCNQPYPITSEKCPHCNATNANVDLESATREMELRREPAK